MDPRHAITQLIYTYAERIDAGDFEGVGELLGSAALTFEGYDTSVTGTEAIKAMYEHTTRRFDDGTPKTKHVMTNVIVEVADHGQRASSRSYYTVLHAVPGAFALAPVVAGRYHDTFVYKEGRWRFETMHIIVDLVGDVTTHLNQSL